MREPVETFHGPEGAYLTRVNLPLGLAIHVFHRGDADPDPHDHKQGFVTLPLQSYVESVYRPRFGGGGRDALRVVRAGRLHFRRRTHIHRVLGRWSGDRDRLTGAPEPTTRPGGFATVVLWIGARRESWGFWVWPGGLRSDRVFQDWREYLAGRLP